MISRGILKDISFHQGNADLSRYPFSLPFIKDLDKLKIDAEVTFFVGSNGTGKSTLLEAIAVASGFNPEGGTVNFNFNTRSSHSPLHQHIRTSRGIERHKDGFFLRGESYFNLGTEIERLDEDFPNLPPIIDSYGGKSLHEQSHGESFWALFMHRFSGNGFYLLDEPESALAVERQMAMLVRMRQLVLTNSQFIIATHSPLLLAYPGALIYEFGPQGIQQKNYQETLLYQQYSTFFKDPALIVKQLLNR